MLSAQKDELTEEYRVRAINSHPSEFEKIAWEHTRKIEELEDSPSSREFRSLVR